MIPLIIIAAFGGALVGILIRYSYLKLGFADIEEDEIS